MQRIYPNLWYHADAKGAVELYKKAFTDVQVLGVSNIYDTPSGDVDMHTITVHGYQLMLMSAGPAFTFSPATSLTVSMATEEEVDRAWNALSEGGFAMMPLGEYPFSKKYGWIRDRYGVSWQIGLFGAAVPNQRVHASLLFVGEKCGKAEEAMRFYASTFRDGSVGEIMRYPAGGKDKEGTVMHGTFSIEGVLFSAMDSAFDHDFDFTEAVSFVVRCDSQEQMDRYWDALSAVPEAAQCGWCKDAFGVSWQIVPAEMDEMMQHGTKEQIAAVMAALMPMKKLDAAALKAAYDAAA